MKRSKHSFDCKSWKIRPLILKFFNTDFNITEMNYKKSPPLKTRYRIVNNIYSYLLKIKTDSLIFGKSSSRNFISKKVFSSIKYILKHIFECFQKKLVHIDFTKDQKTILNKNINDKSIVILKQPSFPKNEFSHLNTGKICNDDINFKKKPNKSNSNKIIILSTW